MTALRSDRFFLEKTDRSTWPETWPSMEKMVEPGVAALSEASVLLTSEVKRTSSTSYLARASSMLRGRPDQMTSSGSMGGMKRVVLEDWMS